MRAPDWPAARGYVLRQIAIVDAHWVRAAGAAAEYSSSGLASGNTGERVAGGSPGSPTEAAALRGDTHDMRRLRQAVDGFEAAALRLSTLVGRLAPPQARMVNGRQVFDCGNVLGCPEGKSAAREGLCNPCWWFRHASGRARTVDDMAEQLERARMGTRDRVAKHRKSRS